MNAYVALESVCSVGEGRMESDPKCMIDSLWDGVAGSLDATCETGDRTEFGAESSPQTLAQYTMKGLLGAEGRRDVNAG